MSGLVFTLAGRDSDFDPLCVNDELREWCSSLCETESPGLAWGLDSLVYVELGRYVE